MERVVVVGSGGAGKTTFANQLGVVTGLPVVHLDELYWRPGWVATPDDEWRDVLRSMVAKDQWIIDGNDWDSQELRFSRADTVIELTLPRRVCIARVLWRVARYRGRAVQAPGCPEHFDTSYLRWLWRFPVDRQPRLDETIARHEGRLESVRLSRPREVRRFLRDHARHGPLT